MRRSLLLVALLFASFAYAQQPDFGGKAQKEAMAKLDFLLGEWTGTGWASFNGRKSPFKGTETIQSKLGGVLFTLQGDHFVEVEGKKIPVHEAFGTLRYDEKKKLYFMRAHLASGMAHEFEFTPRTLGYQWTQMSPQWGETVYTAEFTKDTWLEYGEVTRDGKKERVYEMTMKRKT